MNESVGKYKVLLVEDEESLAVGLEYNLIDEGYNVDWVDDGKKAIDHYNNGKYDLIILDVMLPYFDGFEIAEHIRKSEPQIPILMLTARKEAVDKIKGLELGVDDYLTKPFHLQELLLRIKGMLKRKEWYKKAVEESESYSFNNININFNTLILKHNEKEIQLTNQEALLLKYLVNHKGEIVERGELLKNVWQINPDVETRTVDIFIARLRKYIEEDHEKPCIIKSVRGRGYIFDHD